MTDAYQSSSTVMAQLGIAGTVASKAVLGADAVRWAETRGISRETLEVLGVGSGTTSFPGANNARLPAVFFRFGESWKARSFPDKNFVTKPGFQPDFWNIEQVLAGNLTDVYLVEGEMDALALVEAGVPASMVLSVPGGARQKAADALKPVRGYEYVSRALERGLGRCKRFVWCGDADGPGENLRSDMIRMLGEARFWTVTWPDGIKDANEMLLKDGPEALRELVSEGAVELPVDGLFRISELPEPPKLTLWHPGFDEWENKVLLAPRTLSVVTGHPGHGKTVLWQQIWFQVIRRYDVVACMASFETRAKPHIRRQIRSLLSGKAEVLMDEGEIAKADGWINDHYLFLSHPDQQPTLDWFLDKAEVAVVRHGAKIVQLDPWNRLEASRDRNETETDYIGRCLKSLHAFAHDMNCHVQILAHPAKMDSRRRGFAPHLEDISGSKNWDNMVDQGFVVHREELVSEQNERRTEATLYHRKARFEELGYPCKLKMDYRIAERRFVSVDYALGGYPTH